MRLNKFNFIKNSHHELYELKENDLIKRKIDLVFYFLKNSENFI